MKREKPDVRKTQEDSRDAGFQVTETTVWKGGKSRTFSAQEVTQGDADKWVAE